MKKKAINFFNEEVSFILQKKEIIKHWIETSIQSEKQSTGIINYIFCSDEYLHRINLQYLSHDTYTDILTFNTSDDNNYISGDIFISIDRIKENAQTYQQSFQNELHRVMIHGILHLMGYDDKSVEDKAMMKTKEDYYLSLLPDLSRK